MARSRKFNMIGGGQICPANFFCLEEITFIIIMFITIGVFTFYLFNNNNMSFRSSKDDNNEINNNEIDNDINYDNEIISSPSGKRLDSNDNNVKKIIKEIHYYNHTPDEPSRPRYLADKAYERIINPLLPPERDYEYTYGLYGHHGMRTTQNHVPINIDTRGYTGGFQQIGMLYKDNISDDSKTIGNSSETTILPLYGRPTDTNMNKLNYYTSSDKFNMVKIPISHKNKDCNSEYGCEEIYSSDSVSVPAYNGEFKATIYQYDKPRYLPSSF